jgi:electron transfer flavoprotein alpha/beta subunit
MGKTRVSVKRKIENGWQRIKARLPALVSVSKSEPVHRPPLPLPIWES